MAATIELSKWQPDVIATRPLHQKAPVGTIENLNINDIPSLASLREAIRKIMEMIHTLEGRNGPITLMNTLVIKDVQCGNVVVPFMQCLLNTINDNVNEQTHLLLAPNAGSFLLPVAETEMTGASTDPLRVQIELGEFTVFRFTYYAAGGSTGPAGSKMHVKWTNDGATFSRLEASGGSDGDVAMDVANRPNAGAFVEIDPNAKAANGATRDVILSPWVTGGNGATTLNYHWIAVQLRRG